MACTTMNPPLDVLANILGGGPTSLLYKNLVKSGVAVQAGTSHPCRELSCTMNFYALPNPQKGLSLAKIEQVINDTLLEFEQRGVNDDDLLKTKVSIENGYYLWFAECFRQGIKSCALSKRCLGDANYTEQQVARYNKVTKADVMRVFKQYIQGQGSAVLSIVPHGQEDLNCKSEDNFTLPDVSSPPELSQLNTPMMKNISGFDRSIMPKGG